ncbi:MAG: beta-propeller fold lactonase family protein [Saprospiraceae bacterium]
MKTYLRSPFLLAAGLFLMLPSCQKEDFTSSATNDATLETRNGHGGYHHGNGIPGEVYTMSNSADGNEVIVFSRDARGWLQPYHNYATGGNGTSGGLGSQGAIIVHGHFLFVVNAGSNSITSFIINGNKLEMVQTVNSQGTMPISLTAHGDVLYVLNGGGNGNIAGFSIDPDGMLAYLEGSERPLSAAAPAPAQIEFNNWGTYLVVTEKGTNMLTVYKVDHNGIAGTPKAYPSSGMTPFGFAFDNHDHVIVSEAFGGAPNASAMSSYQLSYTGSISTISGAVPTHQTAACWVAVTENGRYAYTTNFGSNNVSGYKIDPDGTLTLLNSSGVTGWTADGPLDMALSRNSQYLYILNANRDNITMFRIRYDGSLTPLGNIGNLPASAVGLAAR